MKIIRFSLFCCFGLTLAFSHTAQLWAKAPLIPKIVFSFWQDGGRGDIYLMDPDGSNKVNLTRDPLSHDSHPAFSPTGEQILFVSDKEVIRGDLYLMDADGGNMRKVFKTLARRNHPTWSPDGKKIAYVRPNEEVIYIATVEGKEETPLAQVGKYGGAPDWSPDGTEIVFVSSIGTPRESGGALRIINVKTGKQETLLPDELPLMASPDWAPSGDRIVFSWLNRDVHDVNVIIEWGVFGVWDAETLYLINRDSGELIQLLNPNDKGRDITPIWSPWGDEILFTQIRPNEVPPHNIFKFAPDSPVITQLTNEGTNRLGDWFDPAMLPVQPQAKLFTTLWGELKRE